ncbi:MAG: MYXO-CTERM sorting domain-containing protein [Akkermansia sp.]
MALICAFVVLLAWLSRRRPW